jgi:2'-5' RNA ligase
MRLFVSLDLDGLAEQVADTQELLTEASGLRMTDPEQAHITLTFLGEIDEDELPALRTAVESAVEQSGVSPFELSFGGLGVFPSLDYISVVWLGVVEGGTEVTRLHDAIEDRTTALGYDPEDHEFTPHVTLARMDHAGGKDHVQDVVQNRDPLAGEMTVSEIRLTESTLTEDGPVYSTVESFDLSS